MAGEIVHLELPAGDTARSREFWGSLFGWQFEAMEGPVGVPLTRLTETQGAAFFPGEGSSAGRRAEGRR